MFFGAMSFWAYILWGRLNAKKEKKEKRSTAYLNLFQYDPVFCLLTNPFVRALLVVFLNRQNTQGAWPTLRCVSQEGGRSLNKGPLRRKKEMEASTDEPQCPAPHWLWAAISAFKPSIQDTYRLILSQEAQELCSTWFVYLKNTPIFWCKA